MHTIVGITGGIGCGKSTASALLEQAGFRRLDSDRLVRDEVLTSPPVIAALRARFGPEVIDANGAVNRTHLASRVFADESELRWLEELTHPLVFELWRSAFRSGRGVDWAVEVPLLFEKSLEIWFDFTVCVASAPAQQLARLEQRGLPRALAEQRISKQLPLAQKIEWADFVLWNDGSPEFLQEQVTRLNVSLHATR
ncbi:MAG: dephospho-CoA kinase [Opitutus sp.]